MRSLGAPCTTQDDEAAVMHTAAQVTVCAGGLKSMQMIPAAPCIPAASSHPTVILEHNITNNAYAYRQVLYQAKQMLCERAFKAQVHRPAATCCLCCTADGVADQHYVRIPP